MLRILWHVLFWGWFLSEIIVGVVTRTRQSTGNVRDRGSLILLWIVITASITACQWIGEAAPPTMFGGAPWLKTASVIVILTGLAIRWSAIITLGKSFSSNVAIQDTQKIEQSGLFHFVRHPSYLGLLLVFLAIGLHSRSWIALAVVLLPTTAALLYRIRVEEAALNAAFGEQYRAYSHKTKRFPTTTKPENIG
jgi:protein-S-isoprenylcysteine O-methyltransferase Ste14